MYKLFICLIFGISSVFGKKIDDQIKFDGIEQKFLELSGKEYKYPGENFPVIVTENTSALGKLTALHFINWILKNPAGVVALPTGKTPELFIKYLNFYKKHWQEEKVQNELKEYGIDSPLFPDTSELKFVQIDEFFPIDVTKSNSFYHYIKKYYFKILNLKPENILSMEKCFSPNLKAAGIENVFKNGKIDLQILIKEPMSPADELQQQVIKEIFLFCQEYEKKIKQWGGIGFFLAGIGPDGHIGFNQKGSWHNSKTRLVKLNYSSAAICSRDFGGIENSIDKYAITIGLDTIQMNKNAEIIIIAAGDLKGPIVAKSIESATTTEIPATAFRNMKGSKFYVTKTIAKYLNNRKHLDYIDEEELPSSFIDDTLIEISLLKQKPIFKLTIKDLESTSSGIFLSKKLNNNFKELKLKTQKTLIEKIEKKIKLKEKAIILHTSPHHDDIILSYYPFAIQLIGNHENIFCTITSGFNSVTNSYLKEHIKEIKATSHFDKLIEEDYPSFFFRYKQAFKKKSSEQQIQIENSIIAKKIIEIFSITSNKEFSSILDFLIDYLNNASPGENDILSIQNLKGAIRETEEQRAWYLSGIPLNNLIHLRSHFYKSSFFDPLVDQNDINQMTELIDKTKPDIISLALDPEGSGPDTHFKSLELISSAILSHKNENISIWGYRNIWQKFSLSEATLFLLVSQEDMDDLNIIFNNCYSTQNNSPFPNPYFNGDFSKYATDMQKEQLIRVKTLLGENFFKKHHDKRIRNAKGLILMKELSLSDLAKFSSPLEKDFHRDSVPLKP